MACQRIMQRCFIFAHREDLIMGVTDETDGDKTANSSSSESESRDSTPERRFLLAVGVIEDETGGGFEVGSLVGLVEGAGRFDVGVLVGLVEGAGRFDVGVLVGLVTVGVVVGLTVVGGGFGAGVLAGSAAVGVFDMVDNGVVAGMVGGVGFAFGGRPRGLLGGVVRYEGVEGLR
ncbi:hypothetical protein QC764_0013160 [Podospora pseudoanserina]|uniref:Uncharacterized protein n=1 Tax=Podospora pseudoanserina TaxID=2609844 RepID=A0ABR0IP14_9PEZI|nr:hypothetical protein QC764_0013160 [Podospora pseudoanserina]